MATFLSFHLQTWQFWLYVYLTVGALIALIYLSIELKKRYFGFASKMMSAIRPESTKDKILTPVVLILAAILFALFYPLIALWFYLQKRKVDIDSRTEIPLPQFRCSPQFLIAKQTVQEAVKENSYVDPDIPPIPFGHLNKAWLRFISELSPNEELWSFLIPNGQSEYFKGQDIVGQISGYARIKDGKIVGEFLVEDV